MRAGNLGKKQGLSPDVLSTELYKVIENMPGA